LTKVALGSAQLLQALGLSGSIHVSHETWQDAHIPPDAKAVPLGQTQVPPRAKRLSGQAVHMELSWMKHSVQGKSHGSMQVLEKL
jgi:hypothetical protein